MDKIIIGIAYILAFLFFGILIKIRIKKEKQTPQIIYVLIVLIISLIIDNTLYLNYLLYLVHLH